MKFKIALAAALIAAGSANAATVTSSFTNPLAVTEINQTGSLDRFNSALGTLTGAILTVTDLLQTDITFTNKAAQSQNFKYNTQLDLTLTTSLAALQPVIQNAAPGTATDSLGTTTLAAGGVLVKPQATVAGTPTTVDLSGILASLIGTTPFTITCTSFTPTTISQVGGNITSTQTTRASCGASIVYTYNAVVTPPAAVPVPASVALLGLGLLAAGAVRRRKA
jgi:PEP-CTERM motif